jgi:hypothetical protein
MMDNAIDSAFSSLRGIEEYNLFEHGLIGRAPTTIYCKNSSSTALDNAYWQVAVISPSGIDKAAIGDPKRQGAL